MKIKAKIYAKTLIDSLSSDNLEIISQNFWKNLQKNKQYREMPKILKALDEEFAQKNNFLLAYIYSAEKLEQTQISEIENKLKSKFGQNILIKNIVKINITGLIIEVDQQILDFSLENKIKRLKQAIL